MGTEKTFHSMWINALIATCEQGYGLIKQGVIAIKDKRIAWIGGIEDLPGKPNELADHVYDVQGRCITPGLIDCHTHVVYAGNRAYEFEMRLQGKTYEEIARAGGGIQSTVTATREASFETLLQQSMKRVSALLASGITTLEIKSGYGLDLATELKILRVAKEIETLLPMTVSKTFLGAHAIPIEYRERADAYIDLICDEMIPVVAKEKLADAVDVFCEKIAFNLQQTERVFKAAKDHGLKIKCHSEQLTDSGSAILAAKYHALSVDHLEHVSEHGVKAIAQSHTTAVLLPGAFYFLRESKLPPIELLRQYNVPIAIATDCNPGTSPVTSLLLILNMACTLFRMTPEEALAGVTKHAAAALGMTQDYGTLTVGKFADFAVWDVAHPAELAYHIGWNPLQQLVRHGAIVKNID